MDLPRPTGSAPRRCVLLAAMLLCPAAAVAGGSEVGDTGAEALGRGGSFVAKADNPTAINYNPAGFVKLRGHHVGLSGSAVHSTYSFTRLGGIDVAGREDPLPYPTVDNTRPWMVVPLHLMVTTDLGYFERWTFAAGIYGPPQAGRSYATEAEAGGSTIDAPQRYDMVGMEGLIMWPAVALAFRPLPWIDIGLSFQWMMTTAKTTTIATAGSACDKAEDSTCDIKIEIEAEDWFAPTGSAGVLLRPLPWIEVGAMVRLPATAELEGKANITVGPTLTKLQSSMTKPMVTPLDPDVSMTYSYPWMVRAGARYVHRRGGEEVADVEIDFTWENWSAVDAKEIRINAYSLGKPMEPTVMDWQLKDTYALRLGGAYRLEISRAWDLVFRLGGFYETEATEVSNTSLFTMGTRRIGLTGGLGLRWGRVRLDAAYGHVFMPDREVNRSTVTAMDFGGNQGPVVGNGTYSASVDLLSVQLTVSFDRPPQNDPYDLPRSPTPEPPPGPLAQNDPQAGAGSESLGFAVYQGQTAPQAPQADEQPAFEMTFTTEETEEAAGPKPAVRKAGKREKKSRHVRRGRHHRRQRR